LIVVDEMMDGRGFWGWVIRRLAKNAQKTKKHSMRGASIDDKMIGRIKNYIELCKETCNWFIFGHTHVPQAKTGDISCANSGCWISEGGSAPNNYIVIDDKVTIKELGGGIIWQG